MAVPADLDRRVRERAQGRCEYCRLPQSAYALPFQVDHIIARQHGGKTRLGNLALACPRCNRNKGPNIASVVGTARQLVPLYDPCRDRWVEHFRWRGPRLVGLTPVGRATVRVLGINHPDSVALRRELIAEGVFPPPERRSPVPERNLRPRPAPPGPRHHERRHANLPSRRGEERGSVPRGHIGRAGSPPHRAPAEAPPSAAISASMNAFITSGMEIFMVVMAAGGWGPSSDPHRREVKIRTPAVTDH
jgi:HNH endonuclease